MNKFLLLRWVLEDVEDYADKQYEWHKKVELEEDLHELNTRRDITLPTSLPKTPEKMLPVLRKHFKDNVTFISLVLNHYFPEKYIFYRVSKLEPEIFEGFEYFAEVAPMLNLPFSYVGRKGLNRYLTLNEALLEFSHTAWPELNTPQINLTYFLYQILGEMFLHKSDYNRYWVMATQEQYFEGLDAKEKEVIWSGRKEIQPGDLVFVYRTAPRKAITEILRIKDEPVFDPWGAWDGFWVNLEKVCSIDDIAFSTMANDPIFKQWGLVRRNFVGTVTEPVPHSIYNRILDEIPTAVKQKHSLNPEPVATTGRSGQFTSEADFEEKVIEPMLKRWGFKYKHQYACPFRIGSQNHRGRVDFYVSDQDGSLTLFEDKYRIFNDEDLKLAVNQAKSYALLLGMPSFVVASPEGLWLYSLSKNEETLVKKLVLDEVDQKQEEKFRHLLLKLRKQ
jgi:hypothetical protein